MAKNVTAVRKVMMAVEVERVSLIRLDALLGCVALALEYDDKDDHSMDMSSYADVILIARRLVEETHDNLESSNLERAIAGFVDDDSD